MRLTQKRAAYRGNIVLPLKSEAVGRVRAPKAELGALVGERPLAVHLFPGLQRRAAG